MMARIAAAATITHFAHVAGHQNMAKTTTAKANKNRQKQSFMIFLPPSTTADNTKAKMTQWQGQNPILSNIPDQTR
jgi:hypothetical protein